MINRNSMDETLETSIDPINVQNQNSVSFCRKRKEIYKIKILRCMATFLKI